jgi:phosphoribosylanthranilate isomerase
MTAIKFCGLTRRRDVDLAAELGAAYVGVIPAAGARHQTARQASDLFARDGAGGAPDRVGVFGAGTPDEIARAARAIPLEIVQLHDVHDAAIVTGVRAAAARPVWAVVRCDGEALPAGAAQVAEVADGVLLDAYVPGRLGGTGVALPWEVLAEQLTAWPRRSPLVLAGGLTPENVDRAIAAIRPDVVDVSSGVESSPGVKDPARMRAFAAAVAEAG